MEDFQQPSTIQNPSTIATSTEKPIGKKFLIIAIVVIILVFLAILFGFLFLKSKGGVTQTGTKSVSLTNYPSDLLPTYPNSTPIKNDVKTVNGKKTTNVILRSEDSPEQVKDFYQSFLGANGWQAKTSNLGGFFNFEFHKDQSNGQIDIKQSSENQKLTEITIVLETQ